MVEQFLAVFLKRAQLFFPIRRAPTEAGSRGRFELRTADPTSLTEMASNNAYPTILYACFSQSKKRGLSLEEKRTRLLDIFFEKVRRKKEQIHTYT